MELKFTKADFINHLHELSKGLLEYIERPFLKEYINENLRSAAYELGIVCFVAQVNSGMLREYLAASKDTVIFKRDQTTKKAI